MTYEEQRAKNKARFREAVRGHLTALHRDLGSFMQTTHATFTHSRPIDAVCHCLASAWDDPSAFNVSELDQAIRRLLKEEK